LAIAPADIQELARVDISRITTVKKTHLFHTSHAFYMRAVEICAEDTNYHDPEDPNSYDQSQDFRHHLAAWDLPSIGVAESAWKLYNEVIASYTKREPTYKSGTLFAISGVLKVFSRYCDDAFICGLPEELFSCALLWQPLGSSKRDRNWPSWSWAGWTGSVRSLATGTIEGGTGPRTFVPSFPSLTLVSSNGSEAAVKWLGFENPNVIAWFGLENRVGGGPLKLMERLPDNPFLEGSYLEFSSRATFLSIVPGPEVKGDLSSSVGTSILHKYHILDGQDWVGTILLSPECAA